MNRYSVSLTLVAAAIPTGSLMAQPALGEVSAVSVGIDLLLFVAGLLCFATSMKIFTLLRGGELSSGWQILSVSFLLFSIAQALELSIKLEFFKMPDTAISVMQAVAVILIFIGVARIKRALT